MFTWFVGECKRLTVVLFVSLFQFLSQIVIPLCQLGLTFRERITSHIFRLYENLKSQRFADFAMSRHHEPLLPQILMSLPMLRKLLPHGALNI